jgi:hypothetical protein
MLAVQCGVLAYTHRYCTRSALNSLLCKRLLIMSHHCTILQAGQLALGAVAGTHMMVPSLEPETARQQLSA